MSVAYAPKYERGILIYTQYDNKSPTTRGIRMILRQDTYGISMYGRETKYWNINEFIHDAYIFSLHGLFSNSFLKQARSLAFSTPEFIFSNEPKTKL